MFRKTLSVPDEYGDLFRKAEERGINLSKLLRETLEAQIGSESVKKENEKEKAVKLWLKNVLFLYPDDQITIQRVFTHFANGHRKKAVDGLSDWVKTRKTLQKQKGFDFVDLIAFFESYVNKHNLKPERWANLLFDGKIEKCVECGNYGIYHALSDDKIVMCIDCIEKLEPTDPAKLDEARRDDAVMVTLKEVMEEVEQVV